MNLWTRIIRKIKRDKWKIRAFFPSLIFNFRHLPFSQARHLPILIYKGHCLNNSGKFIIEGEVYFGMIELGRYAVSLFPSNGIVIENRGVIVFHGKTEIGNDSVITLGDSGKLEFGKNFSASAGLKIACYDSITFGDDILIGWNTMIVDTDFHSLKEAKGGGYNGPCYAPISIGDYTWLGNGCKIYKGVSVPAYCVVGADTILHKKVDCEPYSLITNVKEVRVKYTGYYREKGDDKVEYGKQD